MPVQEMSETRAPSLGQDDPLEEGMAAHSSILAWRIPWTEDPGGLQSRESQKSQTRLMQPSMRGSGGSRGQTWGPSRGYGPGFLLREEEA